MSVSEESILDMGIGRLSCLSPSPGTVQLVEYEDSTLLQCIFHPSWLSYVGGGPNRQSSLNSSTKPKDNLRLGSEV